MEKPDKKSAKIIAYGLSSTDVALLRSTLTNGRAFFDREWIIDTQPEVDGCAVAIVDIDTTQGKHRWQMLNNHGNLVKIAYTGNPETIGQNDFKLTKPLWGVELMIIMQRAVTALDTCVETPSLPVHQASYQTSKPPVSPSSIRLDNRLNDQDRFKLKRWPDFKKINYTPCHVRIAVMIRKTAHDINSLTNMVDLPRAGVVEFINRCYELGYLEIESGLAAVVTSPQVPRRSLFQKIRNRLGL